MRRFTRWRRQGPWFRRHPALAVGVSVVMFAGVFVLRLWVGGSQDTITALYALPVALLALAFGLRPGVLAGAAGMVLLSAWVVIDDISLTPAAWSLRVLPLLLLGVLLGSAADRLRAAADAEKALVGARLREREAAEINDSIIQGLAVAKWWLEAGDRDRGLKLLTETIETTQALVGDLLHGRPLRPGH